MIISTQIIIFIFSTLIGIVFYFGKRIIDKIELIEISVNKIYTDITLQKYRIDKIEEQLKEN